MPRDITVVVAITAVLDGTAISTQVPEGDFRFHDFWHDLATKLLRETGNLKLVQKALNHGDIKSTLRCAHVLDEEVADAVERVAKSRIKSSTRLRKAI